MWIRQSGRYNIDEGATSAESKSHHCEDTNLDLGIQLLAQLYFELCLSSNVCYIAHCDVVKAPLGLSSAAPQARLGLP